MSEWSDGYKDPRWQKKRLEVLERDGWKCVSCGDGEHQLQVHHGYYAKGAKIWEYENHTLWTLCDKCHVAAHREMEFLKELIGGFRPKDLDSLRWIVARYWINLYEPEQDQAMAQAAQSRTLRAQQCVEHPCDPRVEAAYKHVVGAVLVDPGLVPRMQPWMKGCPLDSLTAVMEVIVTLFEDEDAALSPTNVICALGDHPVRDRVLDLYEVARTSDYPAHQLLEESIDFLENCQREQRMHGLRKRISELARAADAGDSGAKQALQGVQAELLELHKGSGLAVA